MKIAGKKGFYRILNPDRKMSKDGKEVIIPVKVTDITKKGEKEKDVSLKPGDIIFVPESFF